MCYTHLLDKGLKPFFNTTKYWTKGQYLMIIQLNNERDGKNDG
jgi:hypothetical protein